MTDGGGGSVVVGAAQALSRPVEKLIEVVSAGMGRYFEPRNQRRLADAEAYKRVTLAKAEADVADISARAAERVQAVEARRQVNLEAISDAAVELVKALDSPPARAVAPDWVAKFFDECKDVSDASMQAVWARLLAGEFSTPGKFSVRTMRVLSGLSLEEAEIFQELCARSYTGVAGAMTPFCLIEWQAHFEAAGLGFDSRSQLVAAGLIHEHTSGLAASELSDPLILVSLSMEHVILAARVGGPTALDLLLPLGTVSFTPAGRELSKLWEGAPDATHAQAVVELLESAGFRVALSKNDAISREYPLPPWAQAVVNKNKRPGEPMRSNLREKPAR